MGIETILAGAALAIAAAGTGYSVYSGERAAEAQEESQLQSLLRTEQQAKKSEEAMNKANQKKPNTAAILSAAQQAAKGGVGGTMLTGPQGVGQDQLSLGKTSLLGS